jgi:ABC-2 type transport system ATP-binding protein
MHAIETHRLTKFYGRTRGIEGMDLEVREGEVFGFIGPNGAGKSTTIRTLLGLVRATSGQARVLGFDPWKQGREARRRIGYVPAEVRYYEGMRVFDIIGYASRFYPSGGTGRLGELLDVFQLDASRKVEDLSTGNRKKLAIVQALIHRPSLLILDEPTMGLDPLMQEQFFTVVRKVHAEGMTIFFSSHVLQEVERICDRVAVVKDGAIVEVGGMGTLRAGRFVKVRLSWEGTRPKGLLALEGVIPHGEADGVLELRYDGDPNLLVRELARANLRRFTVTEPSLDEIFLHYYER